MEWTGVGSPKKRKDGATYLAVAAGGVINQVGLVTLHKKPRRVNEAHPTAREKVEEEEEEEEGDGTESVTTVLSSMPASARIDAPSPPSPLQRPPPRPEADAAIDRGDAGEVVMEELTTVAELVKKGGSGLLVRRPALGHRLAVFWRRDRPFVVNDACPHRGAPLSEGDIEDLVVDEDDEEEAGACPARRGRGGEKVVPHVVCPLHYYKYDLASGRCHEGGDWSESLKVYEAWVEGDRVMAKLPRLPPISDDDEDDSDDDDER